MTAVTESTGATAGVVCPICGWTGDQFDPMGHHPRPNARCPGCGSLERHRTMFLYLRDETPILTRPTRLLHFAPESSLKAVFERQREMTYVTTDLEMPGVSMRMDAADLLFQDRVFDCVICSHVLEHVSDDYRAMREISRVLRPQGFALILVPILSTPDGRTIEDPSVTTSEDRERVYGQSDHVRKYGTDFVERARASDLEVVAVPYPRDLGVDAMTRFGLQPREQLFVCMPTRPKQ